MKLKLRLARWIARRIEKRSRIARRELRDYRRQEGSRIKRDERRTRGLRLYIAWSQPPPDGQHFRAATVSTSGAIDSMRSFIPVNGNVPRIAH